MGNEASFIQKMRAKYPMFQTTNGVRPPQAVTPSNGMRFTGNGPKDQVAGVVHRGEQVIEAPMVEAAGGPEAIRDQVEGMASEQRGFGCGTGRKVAGYQFGTGRGVVQPGMDERDKKVSPSAVAKDTSIKPPGQRLEENRSGIGRSVGQKAPSPIAAPASAPLQKAGGAVTPQTPQISLDPRPAMDVQGGAVAPQTPAVSLDKPPAMDVQGGEIKPVEPVAPVKGTRDFGGVTDKAISDIQDTAAGKSEADRIARERMEGRLAGEAAAEQMSLAQSQAMKGVEGGTAAAEQANLRRQQSVMAAEERGALSEKAAERQEKATESLARIGLQGEQMEEGKRQFEELLKMDRDKLDISKEQFAKTFGLDVKKVDEMIRQYNEGRDWEREQWGSLSAADKERFRLEGETLEQAEERYLWTKKQSAIEGAAAAGDFDTMAQIYKDELGIDIDVETLQDTEKAAEFGNAIANVETAVSTGTLEGYRGPDGTIDYNKAINDPDIGFELKRAAVARGMDPNSAQAKTWMKQTLENRNLMQDPFYSASTKMSDQTVNGLVDAITGGNPDSFEFNGQKGASGMRLFTTALMAEQALGFGEDGNLQWDANSNVWDKAGGATTKAAAAAPTPTEKPKKVEDVPGYFNAKLEEFEKNQTFEGNQALVDEFSNMTRAQIEEIMEDRDLISRLEENGVLTNKTLNANDVFKAADVKKSGLKFEKANTEGATGRMKTFESKKFPEVVADQGSVVIHNGAPYQLVEYKQIFDKKDSPFGKDKRRVVVTAKNLITGETESIVNERRKIG